MLQVIEFKTRRAEASTWCLLEAARWFANVLESGPSDLPSAHCFGRLRDLAQVRLRRRPMLVHGQSDVSPETRLFVVGGRHLSVLIVVVLEDVRDMMMVRMWWS